MSTFIERIFPRSVPMRLPAIFFACLMLVAYIGRAVAQTNAASVLADPNLWIDMLRTNPAGAEAVVQATKAKYEQALTNGRTTIPFVREFRTIFTNYVDFISYYIGQAGPQTWVSKGSIHGRYLISMHMHIKLDETGTNIVSYDPPEFELNETKQLRKLSDGRVSGDDVMENFRRFGPAEWQKILESKGDLSVLGITVKTNNPVPLFEENWKRF